MKHAIACILLLTVGNMAFAQKNDSAIALVKKNLADSKEKIKQYEWIETTIVYMKGEQKSSTQKQCYYDVNGKVVKVAVAQPASDEKSPRGVRGKVVENKKDEMQDYIQKAVAKVHSYLPPDPAKLQQISAAGKVAVNVLQPNTKIKIDFPDYLQKGDLLSIKADKEKYLIDGLSVNTYLDNPDDKINFDVTNQWLPDGAQYAGETTLNAPAKDLKIVIQNSGYKKKGG
jgi:hypothetical protein